VASADSPLVATTIAELHKVKRLADKAIAQLDDQQLWRRLDPESNSIGVLMRHTAGNMRSRWVEFRTSDGEKPTRQRDQEFEDASLTRESLLADWEEGWGCLFAALTPLRDADLQETVYIRYEAHTIYQAIIRQVVHYAGHVYQILAIGKQLKGPDWVNLSVPRGKSDELNQRLHAEHGAGR